MQGGEAAAPAQTIVPMPRGLHARLRGTWATTMQRPIVAVIPVLLLAAMLTAGLVVVEVEARKEREDVKDKVRIVVI